jgi:putative ABC transport system permease protein
MNVSEAFRFAWRGVGANRMRSALTTLGILIGVAAVIILVAVGTGSSAAVRAQIEKLGSNTLTVSKSTGSGGGGGFAAPGGGAVPGGGALARLLGGGSSSGTNTGTEIRAPQLTIADAAALLSKSNTPDIAAVAPTVSAQSVTATYRGQTHSVGTFTGSTPSYLSISNDTFAAGTSFTDSDYTSHARVAVLGATVAKDLFGGDGTTAVGKTVEFNGITFQVTGVLTAKGSTGPFDQDDVVVAPLTTTQDTLSGQGDINSITVQARSAGAMTAAESELEAVLDGRHHVTAADRDYSVQNQASILTAATSSNRTFTVLLAAVAAISLLVGGIGVMNIMLVTVTERTREIGIRKAIGANRSDVVSQFLLEAILLSLFGGLVGVAVGLIGSHFTIVGVKPVVAPYSVALAFGVAILVGLFFGIYPANRASALKPVDALRYE